MRRRTPATAAALAAGSPSVALCWSCYSAWGGLAQFGRPLTETFKQRLEDGQEADVQYFERARFEWHPEVADAEYRVLLGQFGRRVLAEITR